MKALVGSGHKIALVTLPFLVVGLTLNMVFPVPFSVGGPPNTLRLVSIVVLVVGVVIWVWSVLLILTRVPRGELITTGPYTVVMHPLYTSVALLVLPWVGFLLNSWLGALIGIVMYIASRRFAIEEEASLAETFGRSWHDYRASVRIPWL